MRAGIFVAYWPWFRPDEQVSLAVLADELGLDSVWVAEAWGQDAVSVLAFLAARTERIALGSALMQIPARPPTTTAMAAVSLDVLSGGRFRLGLGVSGPQVSEGWYGVPFARPVSRTREYVEIVRAALARKGPLEYKGREYTLPMEGGTGLGKPLKLLARPVQERIPVYLGAVGPRAVEQVGEIADGWLPFLVDPGQFGVLTEPLQRGRADRVARRADVQPVAGQPALLHRAGRRALPRPLGELDDRRAGGRDGAGVHAGGAGRRADAGVHTLVAVPCGPDRPAIVRALAAATVEAAGV